MSDITQVDVFYVEDSKLCTSLISDYLKLKSVSCKIFHNGYELFKELEENIKPRIILLDYNLPDGFNGDKIFFKLRDNKKYNNISIFFITAMSKEFILKILKGYKPEGIIEKPFSIKDLAIIITKLYNKNENLTPLSSN